MTSTPIIVTEIPRSGAGLVAYVLSACGAWNVCGDDHRPRLNDAGGNRDVRDLLVRPLFRGLHCDVLGVDAMPDLSVCEKLSKAIAPRWRSQIESILQRQGYTSGAWLYRGSDALLVWPIWAAAFPDAVWVFARRDEAGISRSCKNTDYADLPNDELALSRWLRAYTERVGGLVNAGIDILEIWPGRFLTGQFDELEKLVRTLSLKWDPDAVCAALTPVLWSRGVFDLKGAGNVTARN